jgi:enamine deaminase RidA (YjgF/YER057c/UK114 family)
MTFNIGSQTGAVVNNVGGDQHISGGQHGTMTTEAHARQALASLRRAVATAGLDETTAVQAGVQLTEMDTEMSAARPDRPRFARALERLTRLLVSAGSLAAAGGALLAPLHTLAAWLGAAGQPILALLAAVA